MSAPLTERQRKLLDFIRAYIAQHGIAPTYDDIRYAMRVRSKSDIHRLLVGLEERGAIRRMKARARAIEVVDPGSDTLDMVLAEIDAFAVDDGWGDDSDLFRRLKHRIRQRLGAAEGGEV